MNMLSESVTDKTGTSKCPLVDDQKDEKIPCQILEKKRKILNQLDSNQPIVKRCQLPDCKKKLGLIDLSIGSCKCKKNFCIKHYSPDEHTCDFDYRKESKELLEKKLVQVTAEKIKKI